MMRMAGRLMIFMSMLYVPMIPKSTSSPFGTSSSAFSCFRSHTSDVVKKNIIPQKYRNPEKKKTQGIVTEDIQQSRYTLYTYQRNLEAT